MSAVRTGKSATYLNKLGPVFNHAVAKADVMPKTYNSATDSYHLDSQADVFPGGLEVVRTHKETAGTITDILTGKEVYFDMERVGTGIAFMLIRLTFSSSGATTYPVAPHLLEYLDIIGEQGNELVDKVWAEKLFADHIYLSPRQLEALERYTLIDKNLLPSQKYRVEAAAHTNKVIFLYLPHTIFDHGGLHLPAFSEKPRLRLFFTSKGPESGVNPSLTDAEIITYVHQKDNYYHDSICDQYRMSTTQHKFISGSRVERQMTMNSSLEYRIELSGLQGYMGGFWIFIRPAALGSQTNRSTFFRPRRIGLQNSSGTNINGGQNYYTEEIEASMIEHFDRASVRRNNMLYFQLGFDPIRSNLTGTNVGGFYMTNDDFLVIETGASGTNQVFTATQRVANGTATALAGGYVQYGWQDPDTREISYTGMLAYNTSVANTLAAVTALPSFHPRGTFTQSATLAAASAVTFTMGGWYGAKNLPLNSLIINVFDGLSAADITISTPGVLGWVDGDYNVSVYGDRQHSLEMGTKDGRKMMSVHRS